MKINFHGDPEVQPKLNLPFPKVFLIPHPLEPKLHNKYSLCAWRARFEFLENLQAHCDCRRATEILLVGRTNPEAIYNLCLTLKLW
jgi:hypothetical protein